MSQPTRSPSRALALLAALLAAGAAGCGMVSKSRVEDCRGRVQVLQAENQQLRDVVLNVRSQNRDLAQRSSDDARRVRALEEANVRYERSLAQYQEERDQLLGLVEQIRSQVRTASLEPPPTALLGRLDAFARSAPGARLNPTAGSLELSAADLFEAGSAALTTEGEARLDALAGALAGPDAAGLALSIAGPDDPGSEGIRLASTEARSPVEADPLGLERARKVRDRLTAGAGIDPTRVAVSGSGRVQLVPSGDGIARAGGESPEARAVVIRIRRLADPSPIAGAREADLK